MATFVSYLARVRPAQCFMAGCDGVAGQALASNRPIWTFCRQSLRRYNRAGGNDSGRPGCLAFVKVWHLRCVSVAVALVLFRTLPDAFFGVLMSDSAATPPVAWTPRRVILATLVALAVTVSFWLAYRYSRVLFLGFVAIVLSTALRPLVQRLERWGCSRVVASLLVYGTLLALFVGGAVTIVPLLADQVLTVVEMIPREYTRLREEGLQASNPVLQTIAQNAPHQVPRTLATSDQTSNALEAVLQAFGYVGDLMWGLLVTVITLCLAFLWSLESERSIRGLLLMVPSERRELVRDVIAEMEEKVGAYVRGEALLCVIVGSLALAAYLSIGLPQPLALAFIVGMFEALPVFGPIVGAIPALLVALTTDIHTALWVLLANLIIQQTENYILVPRVMDRSVGVSPIVTLLAIAGFGALIGPLGAVMAIPLAAIIQTLLARFVLKPAAAESPPRLPGRDRLSRIRYNAQEIVQDARKQLLQKDADSGRESDELEETIEAIAAEIDRALADAEADIAGADA
jgi:predicted PurR-regulated permease PerM